MTLSKITTGKACIRSSNCNAKITPLHTNLYKLKYACTQNVRVLSVVRIKLAFQYKNVHNMFVSTDLTTTDDLLLDYFHRKLISLHRKSIFRQMPRLSVSKVKHSFV